MMLKLLFLTTLFQFILNQNDHPDPFEVTNTMYIKLDTFIANFNRSKILLQDVRIVSPRKITLNFVCNYSKEKCQNVYQMYSFFAFVENGRKVHLRVATEGKCFGRYIQDYRDFDILKLEFPDFVLQGRQQSFLTTERVVFMHKNWRRKFTLDLRPHNLLTASLNLTEHFVCLNNPKKPVLFNLTQSCGTYFSGLVYAENNKTLYFENVTAVTIKADTFIYNLVIKAIGIDPQKLKINDQILTMKSTRFVFNGTPINRYFYLPDTLILNGLMGLTFEFNNDNGTQNICSMKLSNGIKNAALRQVKAKLYTLPLILPEHRNKKCPHLLSQRTLSPTVKYTQNLKISSKATYECEYQNRILFPSNFTTECVLNYLTGEAEWKPTANVQCIKDNVCTENFCKNGGACQLNKDNKAFCRCRPGFTGYFCENDRNMDACMYNRCVDGDCISSHNKRGYQCVCRRHAVGELCDMWTAEALERCGFENATYTLTILGRYMCNCPPGFHARLDEQCLPGEAEVCDLPEIPNGKYVFKETDNYEERERLKVGGTVEIECNKNFEKTMRTVTCENRGKLSANVNQLCMALIPKHPEFLFNRHTSNNKIMTFMIYVLGAFVYIVFAYIILKYVIKDDD